MSIICKFFVLKYDIKIQEFGVLLIYCELQYLHPVGLDLSGC